MRGRSLHYRMQVWRFLRIGALAMLASLSSGGHITSSALFGAVVGASEVALRQGNPAVPLSMVESYDSTKVTSK
jgi:hypothetical protein